MNHVSFSFRPEYNMNVILANLRWNNLSTGYINLTKHTPESLQLAIENTKTKFIILDSMEKVSRETKDYIRKLLSIGLLFHFILCYKEEEQFFRDQVERAIMDRCYQINDIGMLIKLLNHLPK